MSQNNHYVLDFIIPQGPIGPTGPASVTAIVSIHYRNETANGLLTISDNNHNVVLPTNTNIFTLNNNEIIINEDGYYEFLFSGVLKESTSSTKAYVELKVGTDYLATIQLSDGMNEMSFSKTYLLQSDTVKPVTIILNKAGDSNASVENVYLLIKKFSFY